MAYYRPRRTRLHREPAFFQAETLLSDNMGENNLHFSPSRRRYPVAPAA